jgi:hypothetical protein
MRQRPDHVELTMAVPIAHPTQHRPDANGKKKAERTEQNRLRMSRENLPPTTQAEREHNKRKENPKQGIGRRNNPFVQVLHGSSVIELSLAER